MYALHCFWQLLTAHIEHIEIDLHGLFNKSRMKRPFIKCVLSMYSLSYYAVNSVLQLPVGQKLP